MNSKVSRAQVVRKMLEAHPEIITEMAYRSGLTFVPEEESSGNVCFANHEEVMPAFRVTFNQQDVLQYTLGLLHSGTVDPERLFSNFHYPIDSTKFWELVTQGKELG